MNSPLVFTPLGSAQKFWVASARGTETNAGTRNASQHEWKSGGMQHMNERARLETMQPCQRMPHQRD